MPDEFLTTRAFAPTMWFNAATGEVRLFAPGSRPSPDNTSPYVFGDWEDKGQVALTRVDASASEVPA